MNLQVAQRLPLQIKTDRIDLSKSVLVVGALSISLHAKGNGRHVSVAVDSTIQDAAKVIRRLGHRAEELTLANRYRFATPLHVSLKNRLQSLNIELAGTASRSRVPLGVLAEFIAVNSSEDDARPHVFEMARRADATLLAPIPGLTRAQMRHLLRASRFGVIAIDDDVIAHAGPGSWEKVFSVANAVILSASAATRIAATQSPLQAADRLSEFSRGAAIVIVDENRLVVQFRSRHLQIPAPACVGGVDRLNTLAAIITTAMCNNSDVENAAYSASAAMELSSLTDIAELTKRGRVIAAELATVSLNHQATRQRLFAIAVSAATILLGFTLLTNG